MQSSIKYCVVTYLSVHAKGKTNCKWRTKVTAILPNALPSGLAERRDKEVDRTQNKTRQVCYCLSQLLPLQLKLTLMSNSWSSSWRQNNCFDLKSSRKLKNEVNLFRFIQIYSDLFIYIFAACRIRIQLQGVVWVYVCLLCVSVRDWLSVRSTLWEPKITD